MCAVPGPASVGYGNDHHDERTDIMLTTSRAIKNCLLATTLTGALTLGAGTMVASAAGTDDSPSHCTNPDPRYLPRTPDAVEGWMARCTTRSLPQSADGAEAWLR
jgi:hypothetical protein